MCFAQYAFKWPRCMWDVGEVDVCSSHAFNFPLYLALVISGCMVSGLVVYLRFSIRSCARSGSGSGCMCRGWLLGVS